MIDFVFPQNNEQEFIEMAQKLGYDSLCFIYPKNKDISKIKKDAKIKLYSATLHPEKSGFIVARKLPPDLKIIEKGRINLLFELETENRKDFMHHRNSGLNQTVCKFARDSRISVGISFSSVLKVSGKRRGVILGRMMQNIRLCRKYGLGIVVASFGTEPIQMRPWHDLQSFGKVLGVTSFKILFKVSGD